MRAFADKRLKRSHISVLAVISYFDRFGRNGAGCYASQGKIAQLAGCNAETVSRSQKDLQQWGYIVALRQKNRRRLQYRVVHDTCATAQVSEPDTCATGQEKGPETCAAGQTNRTNKREPENRRCNPPARSEIDPDESAASAHAPAAPDADCEFHEVSESQLWAYRARLSRALTDGYQPDAQTVEDVGRLFEHVSLGLDNALAGAFEDLYYRVETEHQGVRNAT